LVSLGASVVVETASAEGGKPDRSRHVALA